MCLLISCSAAVWAQANQQHEQSLRQVTEQIQKISTRLNANKKLLKSERDKLMVLEQQAASLQNKQRDSESQITQHRQKIAELESRVESLLQEQQADLQALTELLQNRYKQGAPNYLKLLLNQQNPYAVGRLSHYYRYFAAAQQQKLSNLSDSLNQVEVLQREASQTSLALEEQKQRLEEQAEQLAGVQRKRRQRIAKLDQKVVDNSAELERLNADRERLNTLLKQIAAQAARLKQLQRQRELEAAKQAQAENEAKPAAAVRPSRQPLRGGFKKQRGRLPAPVNAALVHKFGSRLPASGMRAQGHFYATSKSQEVAAVYRGNVLFADYLKGYGLLMIIDHGDDHISLYGHNEVLYKQVGEAVGTGEVVARSGVSGGLKQPGLYFEIRHNAAPVDPAKWLNR